MGEFNLWVYQCPIHKKPITKHVATTAKKHDGYRRLCVDCCTEKPETTSRRANKEVGKRNAKRKQVSKEDNRA